LSVKCAADSNMACAPPNALFSELQDIHDTGYFSSHVSPEEDWQQVIKIRNCYWSEIPHE